ncbi:MAG: hypothetical protein ALECFALPRED_006102 [Alectoria fallacina]|uniref:Uncharacterized protein n=1 Tax=Alectoria fallacina TaxID=1903189 RepID=A0A8H3IDR8_9LECA|nr:MAG: hypothetical protein ALECFALPRED_006102 [Alectoria fallacina]
MPLSTNVANSTAFKQGGMLFILPRELRDEVYRYLVKGTYLVGGQPDGISKDTHSEGKCLKTVEKCLYLDVLRVSKVISDEAMAVLYSESTFRIDVFSKNQKAMLSLERESVDRMMNIELNVAVSLQVLFELHGLSLGRAIQRIFGDILGRINRTNTIRNTLCVKYRILSSNIKEALPCFMYWKLDLLIRFRMVIVKLSPELVMFQPPSPEDVISIVNGKAIAKTKKSKDILKNLEAKIMTIEKQLGRALGPAVVGHLYDPNHLQYAKTLEFHPQEHRATVLRVEQKI